MKMKHLVLSMMAMGLMGAGNVSADEHVETAPFAVECNDSATVCVGEDAYDVSLKCIKGEAVHYFRRNRQGDGIGNVIVLEDGEAIVRVSAWQDGEDTAPDVLLYGCAANILGVGNAYKHEVKCSSTEGRPAHPKDKWGEEDRVEAEIKWSDATCPEVAVELED